MIEILFKKQAQKYFLKSSGNNRKRLLRTFNLLEAGKNDQLDIKALAGELNGMFRIRTGNLRIFYEPKSNELIEVLGIFPRGDAYKKMQ